MYSKTQSQVHVPLCEDIDEVIIRHDHLLTTICFVVIKINVDSSELWMSLDGCLALGTSRSRPGRVQDTVCVLSSSGGARGVSVGHESVSECACLPERARGSLR